MSKYSSYYLPPRKPVGDDRGSIQRSEPRDIPQRDERSRRDYGDYREHRDYERDYPREPHREPYREQRRDPRPRERSDMRDYPRKQRPQTERLERRRVQAVRVPAQKSSSKGLLIFVLAMLAISIVSLNVVIFYIGGLLGRIDSGSAERLSVPEKLSSLTYKLTDSGSPGQPLADDEIEPLRQQLKSGCFAQDKLYRSDEVINILLLSCTRDSEQPQPEFVQSEDIFLLSINSAAEQLVLTEIAPDSCLVIPGRKELERLDAVQLCGGPLLSVFTLESYFGIDIDRYAVLEYSTLHELLNTDSLLKLINILGDDAERVTTDLNKSQLTTMMISSIELSKYSVIRQSLPVDRSWRRVALPSGYSAALVDYDRNRAALIEYIYGVNAASGAPAPVANP